MATDQSLTPFVAGLGRSPVAWVLICWATVKHMSNTIGRPFDLALLHRFPQNFHILIPHGKLWQSADLNNTSSNQKKPVAIQSNKTPATNQKQRLLPINTTPATNQTNSCDQQNRSAIKQKNYCGQADKATAANQTKPRLRPTRNNACDQPKHRLRPTRKTIATNKKGLRSNRKSYCDQANKATAANQTKQRLRPTRNNVCDQPEHRLRPTKKQLRPTRKRPAAKHKIYYGNKFRRKQKSS